MVQKKAVQQARPLINPMNISKNEIFSGICFAFGNFPYIFASAYFF